MSGVLCLALMLSLLPSAGLIQPARAAYWADPYGEQLVEWGIMKPSSDLRLSSTVTRAEFVAMCNRAFGYTKLGSMPFVDVPSSAWYAQDINIAYNAGYFNGTTTDPARPTASPDGTLTREMAAVLIARNLVLQETVGEVTAFTDSHALSEWSRGLIGAAVKEGMIGGYEDGSYRPTQSITRGEVAKMLVSVIGTPISRPDSYELGSVYGNVVISSSDVKLRNTVIAGNLYITGGVDLGNVLLENVTVLGRIVVSGGGESHAGQSSIVLRNVAADELVVDSMIGHFVTVSAYGITDIPVTHVRSSAYLDDSSSSGYGLQYIEFNAGPDALLQLAGTIKEVVNKTPFSTLELAQGTAQKITIDEYAVNSELILDVNTRVDELNLDVATLVHGKDDNRKGDIGDLHINAPNCDVDMLPEHVDIRPGIESTVAGEPVDHTGAAELSTEPRLLAGYPKVANLTPTQVEGQFSGNKQGTIYYAVSELADGSVSEEHLVNNPAYGGTIFEGNSGNIAAASKTVYSRDITKLEPDGSYYLTAMLEDGRGNRSPLKVISFKTPDNTKPELLDGYISRATCAVVQLTGMANKSCMLYWVLLAKGAAVPTPQTFKSGSFGGNYGHGSQSVTKNVPVSINVNNNIRLQEDTDYVLYVWLNDFDGAQNSRVYPFPVHTPDETPPVVTEIMQSDYGESDAQVTFKINEYPSTLYWAVVAESNETFITTEDHSDLYAKIKIESGATSLVHGSTPARGANVDTDILKSVLKGLVGTHSFKLYYVAKDAAGNYSDWNILSIHTLDTDPPHAWLEFSDAPNGSPRANSDIRIVFDEQVKGGKTAKETFVKLYEEVTKAQTGSSAQLKAAKEALAKELDAHFELWYVPKNGSPVKQTANTAGDVPVLGDGGSSNWVVNWYEAVITMENGNMVITLAGTDHDGLKQALNLNSGADYQIRLKGVYDDAFTPNAMAVGSDGVTCVKTGGTASLSNDSGNSVPRLPFTTLYAQVTLVDKGEAKVVDGKPPVYMDIVVEVTPESTRNMDDDVFWDMIIWSDTAMRVDIYRQEDQGDWTKIWNEVTLAGDGAGYSLNNRSNGTQYNRTVKNGLVEGHTYRYGVHITRMGTAETLRDGHEKRPENWTADVNLWFSLVAGEETAVDNLGRLVDSRYDSDILNGYIKEIGVTNTMVNGTPTEGTILYCNRTYNDTRGPVFRTGYPRLTSTSGAITIDVGLDHSGWVYCMVAPADTENGGVFTTTDGTTEINSKNDGSKNDDKPVDDGLTYIPTGGGDAVTNQKNIYFKQNKAYTSPTALQIVKRTASQKETVKYDSRRVGSATDPEFITVKNLKPLTNYYVYIVLGSDSGEYDEIVQIYRIETKKAEPPVIDIYPAGSTGVTMEVHNATTTGTSGDLYDNPGLYYAVWDVTALPPIFNYTYCVTAVTETRKKDDKTTETITYEEWDRYTGTGTVTEGRVMTLLQAMIEKPRTNGKSYFDSAPNELKDEVLKYITGLSGSGSAGSGGTAYAAIWRSYDDYKGVVTQNPQTDDFSDTRRNIMSSSTAEYVVVACAKNADDEDSGSAYGFAAQRSLVKLDTEPPVLQKDGQYPDYIRLTAVTAGSSAYDAFTGDFTITFNKKLYYQPESTGGGSYFEVVYKGTGSDSKVPDKEIKTIIGGGAAGKVVLNGKTGPVGNSITLRVNQIYDGETLEFFAAGLICNGSNSVSNYMVRLSFTTNLTRADFGDKSATADQMIAPAFRVELVKVR